MKVGDRVKSERYGLEGVIQDMILCTHPSQCKELELTLDGPEQPVRFYFHTYMFEVVVSE